MTSSYTNLGIELMVTGANAGTWGTKTNTNLEIVEQIQGYVNKSIAGGAQTTDLAIAEFNADMDFNDQLNQSLLLQAKGAGERFSGQMTRNAEFAKAIGSAGSSYYKTGSLLG